MKFAFVLAGISALALTACSASENEADTSNEAAADQDLTPEGPSIMSDLLGGGEPMSLDIQQAHPNGVVLQLTSIQAKPSETVIGAIVTNGDDSEQSLNRYGNNKQTYIVTGDGSKLYLSPPTNNEKLLIPAGQRMEAELVFLGKVSQGGTATLIINDGDQTGNEHSNRPGFRIPLPLEDAAFSDDGSKKN